MLKIDVSVTEGGRKRPEYNLQTDLNGELSLADFLEFTKASLIVIADEVLREEQSKGFDKNPVVAVDGKVGRPVSSVNPLGTIEFTARAEMKEIILATYSGIMGRSPVLTGEYKNSNYVFLNGQQVATDQSSLDSWLNTNPAFEDKDVIRFVNIQPYARKLERLGVTYGNERYSTRSTRTSRSKRGGQVRVRYLQPNGAYFLTTRAIKSKFKRNTSVQFTFLSGSSLGLKGTFRNGRRGKPGRPYLYPTIVLRVSERGIV